MDETGKLSRRARDQRSKELEQLFKELKEARLEPLRSAARARIACRSEDQARAEAVRKAVRKEQRRLRKRQVAVRTEFPVVANHAGTPETRFNHSRRRPDALLRAHVRGDITDDQLAHAHEIAMVAESIKRDVDVSTASLEARVDVSRSNDPDIIEGLKRVRYHWAYTQWRKALPAPKGMILDMIEGEPLPYSTAARQHGVGHRKAKARLSAALDAWPDWLRESLSIRREDVISTTALINRR